MKYVIIGSAAFYGNKGAAAMLESSVQSISAKDKQASFTLFSIYPEQDNKQNTYKNLNILPARPVFLGAVINPLSLIYLILPPLRPLLRKQSHIKAIAECDAYLDENGVSFIDGREVFLIYNLANILPGILMKKPVIKCSQAMGPFNNKINNILSRIFLPRLKLILARGKQTEEHLKKLGLKNYKSAADYAFSLSVSENQQTKAKSLLKKHKLSPKKNKTVVGLFPSRVVEKKCQKLGIDYIGVTTDFINKLNAKGRQVLLMAHAARGDSDNSHNNDLPVCRKIYEGVKDKKYCIFIDKEVSAQQQRYIISTLGSCLVSRFHAMIAALSMRTPVAVVGWSHKYAEVLTEFGQADKTIDLSKLNQDNLDNLLSKLDKNNDQIRKKLARSLPDVQKSSRVNTDEIINIARD